MFDIGFWELALIGVVALVVIGPERLPRVARTAGRWFGKMRYFISNVKADIDRELKAEELQRVMKEQADSNALHEIYEETRSAVDAVQVDELHRGEHERRDPVDEDVFAEEEGAVAVEPEVQRERTQP